MKPINIIILVVLFSFKSNACSCLGKKNSISKEYRDAHGIYLVKVNSIDTLTLQQDWIHFDSSTMGPKYLAVSCEVVESIKGKRIRKTMVYTPLEDDLCGFPFKLENKYLVYLDKLELLNYKFTTKNYTTRCNRTTADISSELSSLSKMYSRFSIWRKLFNQKLRSVIRRN